jgi:conjugative transposon TraK protein
MFQQLKNIDTAFRHVRLFSLLFLLGAVAICCYTIYRTSTALERNRHEIYLLVNGKLMNAIAIDRKDSLSVELRDHVKMFHFYFYSLEPDEQIIKRHLIAALYLADNSAKQEYDNLTETGYYSNIISGNISQQVLDPDSVQVNTSQPPYYFRYYGKLRIVRETSILTRSLITEGAVRVLGAVSDKNPHGFLIENWKVLENKDLSVELRNNH